MLEKLNQLKNWQAAIIIAVVGLAVFWTGLNSPFMGDDLGQIVNSQPVHSITHIKEFFAGGTFYGSSSGELIGVYYRPLMTTTFSFIYTLFGPHATYFHIFQIILCIASAYILYLFFRYSFDNTLALGLALIFLVHPLNSQNVFSIPTMQDALFFFFGVLGLWLLLRFKTVRSLCLVAICFFLSLLSKETAVLFIAMSFIYLFWWDRQRVLPFAGIVSMPIVFWFALRTHAVGIVSGAT